MKTKQSIKGNNNIQIGVNKGQIIHTNRIQCKIEVVYDPELHITDAQAVKIREKITELVEMIASDNSKSKQALFKQEYNAFYKHFCVSGYKLLPRDRYEEAIKWLQKRISYKGKKHQRRGDVESWRKRQYAAIYTRAREKGLDRDSIYFHAMIILSLKAPISSLKELSDRQLQKLYNHIFTM